VNNFKILPLILTFPPKKKWEGEGNINIQIRGDTSDSGELADDFQIYSHHYGM